MLVMVINVVYGGRMINKRRLYEQRHPVGMLQHTIVYWVGKKSVGVAYYSGFLWSIVDKQAIFVICSLKYYIITYCKEVIKNE